MALCLTAVAVGLFVGCAFSLAQSGALEPSTFALLGLVVIWLGQGTTPYVHPFGAGLLLGLAGGSIVALVVLAWLGGRLGDTWGRQLALEPTSNPDMFIAGPGSDLSGENVIFRRRGDGRVISVLLVQGTYLRMDHPSSPAAW